MNIKERVECWKDGIVLFGEESFTISAETADEIIEELERLWIIEECVCKIKKLYNDYYNSGMSGEMHDAIDGMISECKLIAEAAKGQE